MRIGARYPNAGSLPAEMGLARAARRLEEAGFDSLWTSDHLAMPVENRSRYPFSDDGSIPWPLDLGWSDAIVSLGIAAAVTDRIELGTAVLVAPLRSPLLTAIQIASVSVEAGGRCVLGVGAGWLEEEFNSVGVAFSTRGKRLDAWIEVVRAVWSGSLPVRSGDGFFPNPTEMICRPVPVEPVPLLVGGMSPAALRRAGTLGDGWVAVQPVGDIDPGRLEAPIGRIREHAATSGRDPNAVRVTFQIIGSAHHAETVAERLSSLRAVGVQEVIVDVPWDDDGPEATFETLNSARKDST